MNVTNFFENQLQVILPELFILLSVSTLLLVGVQYSTSEKDGYPVVVKPIAWMVVLVTFLAVLLVLNNSFDTTLLFNNLLIKVHQSHDSPIDQLTHSQWQRQLFH